MLRQAIASADVDAYDRLGTVTREPNGPFLRLVNQSNITNQFDYTKVCETIERLNSCYCQKRQCKTVIIKWNGSATIQKYCSKKPLTLKYHLHTIRLFSLTTHMKKKYNYICRSKRMHKITEALVWRRYMYLFTNIPGCFDSF